MSQHYDIAEVKRAAAGRWPEILGRLGGIPQDVLDGTHHPCPKCGGIDRFRMLDIEAGACYCNQCFQSKCGDGLSALAWATGQGFGAVVRQVAEHLEIQPGSNGHAKSNGKAKRAPGDDLEFQDWNYVLVVLWARHKPGVTVEAVQAAGGRLGRHRGHGVIAFPVHSLDLSNATPAGHLLYNMAGGTLPVGREQVKVKASPGCGRGLVVIGEFTAERLAATEAVFLCEGASDTLALWSAIPPENRARYLVATNAFGATENLKPYAKMFAGKRVVIIRDADVAGETGGDKASLALAPVAAEVRRIRLPYPVAPSHGKDLRYWLGEGHAFAELVALAEAAPVVKASTAAPKADEERPAVELLADAICEHNHFAQDAGGRLYRFSDGCYRRHAEEYILGRVKTLCVGGMAAWSTRLAREVCEFLRVDAPQLWERPSLDVVNIKNGLLRPADRTLLPHDPGHLSPIQLPVIFDPAARCPNIEAAVAQWFPSDAHALAWEIPAHLMVPDTSIQKAILLLGEGSNGKSVYLRLITTFLGKGNVSGLSLHRLEADKYSAARLVGKLANVCSDLPSQHLAGTSIFKTITGGDTLTGEHKFRDSFDFTPFARLVFSANHPPRSKDASYAFFRRWVCVPFDRTFAPAEQIPGDVLDEMLTSPVELSGLLNHALDALDRLRTNRRFSEPESVQKAWEDFHAETDPLSVWLDQTTAEVPDGVVAKAVLITSYNRHAASNGLPSIGPKRFGQALRRLRPNVGDGQRIINSKYLWCYLGIALEGTEI